MTLAAALAGWTDSDGAAFELGRAVGLFDETVFAKVKHIFWTDNALGNGLHDALLALVRAGVIDQREDDGDQFRWHRVVAGEVGERPGAGPHQPPC
jgi:hypothetical protein